MAQRRDERRRLPVAVWRAIDEPLTAAGPPITTHQVGAQAGFIDEHQAIHRQAKLFGFPLGALSLDIGPLLSCRQNCFF